MKTLIAMSVVAAAFVLSPTQPVQSGPTISVPKYCSVTPILCPDISKQLMADTGRTYCTVATEQSRGGVSWTDISNITANDGTSASVAFSGPPNDIANTLIATGYGFTIPSNTTIDGIFYHSDLFGIGFTGTSQLTKDGTTGVGNETAGAGGASDLWGTTWTYSEINASTFGIRLMLGDDTGEPGNGSVAVDSVSLTVYYTVIPTGTIDDFGLALFPKGKLRR